MKKVLRLLFLGLFITASCVPSSGLAVNAEYSAGKALNSSVAVQMSLGSGYGWQTIGSGTVVRQHRPFLEKTEKARYGVVTARHVLDNPYAQNSFIDVSFRVCSDVLPDSCAELNERRLSPGAPGWANDWAVADLHWLPTGIKPAQVRKSRLKTGEAVVLFGHPFGNFLIATGTHSHEVVTPGERGNIYKIVGYAAPGSSGGVLTWMASLWASL